MGLTLLGKDGWQQHYDLMLALSELAAEAAYLHSAIGTMESLVESILAHAAHPLDQVRAYEIQIQAYTSHNRLLDALSTARQALARFGIHFPESPQPEDIQAAFQDLAQETALFNVAEFGNLPVMFEQQQLAVMGIAASMIPAAYIAAPDLFPLVTVLGVKTSIRHGNSPLGAFFYATYSILLTGVLQDIDLATEYSHLALQVMEKFDAKPFSPLSYIAWARLLLMIQCISKMRSHSCARAIKLHWTQAIWNLSATVPKTFANIPISVVKT